MKLTRPATHLLERIQNQAEREMVLNIASSVTDKRRMITSTSIRNAAKILNVKFVWRIGKSVE